jgi:hypothetical protein
MSEGGHRDTEKQEQRTKHLSIAAALFSLLSSGAFGLWQASLPAGVFMLMTELFLYYAAALLAWHIRSGWQQGDP